MAQSGSGKLSLSRSMPSLPVFHGPSGARATADPQQLPAPKRRPALACRPLRPEALGRSFAMLFADSASDRPECLKSWRAHLPPLAGLVARLASSRLPALAKQELVLAAIEDGMSPLEADPHYGRPVLHWACILAPAELVGLLLQSGASAHVNLEDGAGNKPLDCVVKLRQPAGSACVVEALLDAGASLAALPRRGAELLYLRDLEPALLRRLLSMGIDVDGGAEREVSPLQQALARRQWGLASLLLESGADVACRDSLHATPLHSGRLPVWLAEQFWRRCADVNARDLTGMTPLMRAVCYHNLPLARWLVARGARLDAIDCRGATVVDHARTAGTGMLAWVREQLRAYGDGD